MKVKGMGTKKKTWITC